MTYFILVEPTHCLYCNAAVESLDMNRPSPLCILHNKIIIKKRNEIGYVLFLSISDVFKMETFF